jgi:hypothetical protein
MVRTPKDFYKNHIQLINETNYHVNQYMLQLIDFFKPLVGTKILKKSNQFMQSIEDKLKILNLPYNDNLRISLKTDEYNLFLITYSRISLQRSNDLNLIISHQTETHIGNISQQVLTSIKDCQFKRTDYSINELIENQQKIKQLQQQIDVIKSESGELIDFMSI